MPKGQPKLPLEETSFEPDGLPKLRLSPEEMDDVAKLSEQYLSFGENTDITEFTEDDLHANLLALYRLSKRRHVKMSKEHAKKIEKMVIGAHGFFGRKNVHYSPRDGSGLDSQKKISVSNQLQKSDEIMVGRANDRKYDEGIKKALEVVKIIRNCDEAFSEASKASDDQHPEQTKNFLAFNAAKSMQNSGLLDEALVAAAHVKPPQGNDHYVVYPAQISDFYCKLGLDLAKRGDNPREAFKKADEWLKILESGGVSYGYYEERLTYTSALAQAGLFKEAMETAGNFTSYTRGIDAYCQIAIAMKEAGLDPMAAMEKAYEKTKIAKPLLRKIRDTVTNSPYNGSVRMGAVNAYLKIIPAEMKLGLDPSESIRKVTILGNLLFGSIRRAYTYSQLAPMMADAGMDSAKEFGRALRAMKRKRKWSNTDEFCELAINMKKAGLDPAAALEAALKNSRKEDRLADICKIASTYAKCGDFESAVSIMRNTALEYQKQQVSSGWPDEPFRKEYANIARELAYAGHFDKALELHKEIKAHCDHVTEISCYIDILGAWGKAGHDVSKEFDAVNSSIVSMGIVRFLFHTAKAMKEAGLDPQKALGRFDETKKQLVYTHDDNARAYSQLALTRSEILDKPIDKAEITDLMDYARGHGDKKLIGELGILLPFDYLSSLRGTERDALVDAKAELHNFFSIEEVERRRLFDEYRKQVLEQASQLTDRARLKIATRILFNLDKMSDEKNSAAFFMQMAREAKDRQVAPRMLYALADADSYKAKDAVLSSACSGALDDRISWLLINKLINNGYLDKRLRSEVYVKYMKDVHPFFGMAKKETAPRRFLLQATQKAYSQLGLTPDHEVVTYLIKEAETKENLDQAIKNTREYTKEFEHIGDKDKLAKILAENPNRALLFYMLNCGRTKFALINNYDSSKFSNAIKAAAALQVHEKTLDGVVSAFPTEKRAEIKRHLLEGSFPLGGKYEKTIRIDVSNSGQLQSIEREAAGVFGSKQLGVILKAGFYMEKLKGTVFGDELAGCMGLADGAGVIDRIDAAYPEMAIELAKRMSKDWAKMHEKNVLSLSLENVVSTEENRIDIKQTIKGLENQRKYLRNTVRQQYQSKSIDKAMRDGRLEILEEKGRAKLMRYLFEDMASTETKFEGRIFEEWESHLGHVLDAYDRLSNSESTMTKNREVTISYLDKHKDIIEFLRLADAAQCCFTSAHHAGEHQWITRMWKDPLFLDFEIFDKIEPGAIKRNAIGFVFGSIGTHNNSPALFLNGVYLEGKTDAAAQSIVAQIEMDFARPLGCKTIIIGARYGGRARFGADYNNKEIEFMRPRALQDANGNPETAIYDDLTHDSENKVNAPIKSDASIWHKKL